MRKARLPAWQGVAGGFLARPCPCLIPLLIGVSPIVGNPQSWRKRQFWWGLLRTAPLWPNIRSLYRKR